MVNDDGATADCRAGSRPHRRGTDDAPANSQSDSAAADQTWALLADPDSAAAAWTQSCTRAAPRLPYSAYGQTQWSTDQAALWDSPAVAADVLDECIRTSHLTLLGLDEAEMVFGLTSADEIRAEFSRTEYLVIKNDAHHVTGFDEDSAVEVPGLKVDVVEKVGAGDAFADGFLAGVVTGRATDEALRMGHLCAAAALSSTHDSAKPPLQELEHYLALLKTWPGRAKTSELSGTIPDFNHLVCAVGSGGTMAGLVAGVAPAGCWNSYRGGRPPARPGGLDLARNE